MTFLQNIYSLSQQIFRYLYYYTFVTYYRCLYILGLYTPSKITTFLDENNAYIEPLKTKFLTQYNDNQNTNQQIDRLFYDKKIICRIHARIQYTHRNYLENQNPF